MCGAVARVFSPILGILGGASDQKKAADAQQRASDQATATARETAAANKAAAEKLATDNRAAAEKVVGDNKMYADKSAFDADTAMNRANGKQPDVNGLQSRNAMDAKGGISGTMLTGPQGVDPKTLLLGKTTLLGG